MDIGRDAAHLVVDGRHHRDRFAGDVYIGEIVSDLQHRGQSFVDRFLAQMRHVQIDVILVRAAAPAFFDFLVHATRNIVTWG